MKTAPDQVRQRFSTVMNSELERRGDIDRRQGDQRISQQAYPGENRRSVNDRRQGDRRAQIQEEYVAAIEQAKAALLVHGMDSPDFANAALVTEDLRAQLKD